MFLILFLFRLYGVMYRGFTRSEAVGLVCKLLRQAFNGRLFWTRCPVFSTAALPGDIWWWIFPLYSSNKYLCVVLFFLADGSCKILFSCSTGAESRTVEEKKAVYQIRRPLGLVFVISFVGWENCCRSIFRWTLICPSLSQSPDLLVFPATYTPPSPPPTHWLWDLTWTLTMEGSAWLSWPVHRTLALVLS